jgi:hypothetical protein
MSLEYKYILVLIYNLSEMFKACFGYVRVVKVKLLVCTEYKVIVVRILKAQFDSFEYGEILCFAFLCKLISEPLSVYSAFPVKLTVALVIAERLEMVGDDDSVIAVSSLIFNHFLCGNFAAGA